MRSYRIVVADDEPDLREYFERILTRLGHEVVGVASSGEELVALARGARPDVIITDIKMEGRSGLDAVVELRAEMDVSVVVVSGYADRAQEASADDSLVDAFLLKPIKRADLESALAGLGR